MNNKNCFGFDRGNGRHVNAMQDFRDKLGGRNQWFADLVDELAVLKTDRRISEIRIRQGQPIVVAKPLPPEIIPLKKLSSNGKDAFLPTGEHIDNIIYMLYSEERLVVAEMSTIDFSVAIYGVGVFRINYSRYEGGVGLSIRYLEFHIPSFETLRLPKYYTDWFDTLMLKRKLTDSKGNIVPTGQIASGGLVLHIGPTGSGKSTAMAAELQYIAEQIDGTIRTFENPIEYRLTETKAAVDQCEFGVHMKAQGIMTIFETAKSNMLRIMPEVIMVGEVKTPEEIREVVDTGSRGHLVLSTLHAKDAVEALTVMMSVMGNTKDLLARSLRAIVAHHLYLTIDGRTVPIYEIFVPDDTVKQMIYDGQLKEIKTRFYTDKEMSRGKDARSITFSEYIDQLVDDGTITEEDKDELLAYMMIKKR